MLLALALNVWGFDTTVPLTGQSMALAQGDVAPSGGAIVALVGQGFAAAQGSFSISGSATYALVGQGLIASVGTLAPSGTANIALVGQSMVMQQGHFIGVVSGGSTVELYLSKTLGLGFRVIR